MMHRTGRTQRWRAEVFQPRVLLACLLMLVLQAAVLPVFHFKAHLPPLLMGLSGNLDEVQLSPVDVVPQSGDDDDCPWHHVLGMASLVQAPPPLHTKPPLPASPTPGPTPRTPVQRSVEACGRAPPALV